MSIGSCWVSSHSKPCDSWVGGGSLRLFLEVTIVADSAPHPSLRLLEEVQGPLRNHSRCRCLTGPGALVIFITVDEIIWQGSRLETPEAQNLAALQHHDHVSEKLTPTERVMTWASQAEPSQDLQVGSIRHCCNRQRWHCLFKKPKPSNQNHSC